MWVSLPWEGMTVRGKDSFLMDMRQPHELRNRLLFTFLVVAAYMLCRSILLYGVAADETTDASGAQYFLSTLVSGDRYRMTVMALGIAPYLNASLLVQIIFAFRNSTSRAKISKIQSDRWMRWVSVVFSVVMAIVQSYGLSYRPDVNVNLHFTVRAKLPPPNAPTETRRSRQSRPPLSAPPLSSGSRSLAL